MFAFKNKYFLIIESIKNIELSQIKKHNKFIIIYRPKKKIGNITKIIEFRKKCKIKKIEFYIANDFKRCVAIKADGIYLSSYNNAFKALNLKKSNFNIIGSAHNFNEINMKVKQGCGYILLSKLFLVNYDKKSPHLGVIKYSKFLVDINRKLVPLGGINIKNLNKLKSLNCEGFALLSEIKKKPANIINRLF